MVWNRSWYETWFDRYLCFISIFFKLSISFENIRIVIIFLWNLTNRWEFCHNIKPWTLNPIIHLQVCTILAELWTSAYKLSINLGDSLEWMTKSKALWFLACTPPILEHLFLEVAPWCVTRILWNEFFFDVAWILPKSDAEHNDDAIRKYGLLKMIYSSNLRPSFNCRREAYKHKSLK